MHIKYLCQRVKYSCSENSIFVIHIFISTKIKFAIHTILIFYLLPVAEQAGFSHIWSQTFNQASSLKLEREQRSEIDTIKHHTWPRIPMGKWQLHN